MLAIFIIVCAAFYYLSQGDTYIFDRILITIVVLFGVFIAACVLNFLLTYPILLVAMILIIIIWKKLIGNNKEEVVSTTNISKPKKEAIQKEVNVVSKIPDNKGKVKLVIYDQKVIGIDTTDEEGKEIDDYEKKKELNQLVNLIKDNEVDDITYAYLIFRIGLLYEEVIQDYFRACSCVYLATLKDKDNKENEKNYIRLRKLLEKEKGQKGLDYVTCVNEFDDVEKYVNILWRQSKSIETQLANCKNKLPPIPTDNNAKFDDFNQESNLHSLGYKVGKTGLPSYQRKELLRKAINNGVISKYEVIATLERNISMFSGMPSRQQSVSDWNDDLEYVRDNF